MNERSFENPQTRERATLVESARETGGKRSVLDIEVGGGGGVMGHFHDVHQERIEVLAGAIEVTVDGVTHQAERATWSSSSPGSRTCGGTPPPRSCCGFAGRSPPGHAGFEAALQVLFGLARDGQTRTQRVPEATRRPRLAGEVERGAPHRAGPPARARVRLARPPGRGQRTGGGAAATIWRAGPRSVVLTGSRDAAPRGRGKGLAAPSRCTGPSERRCGKGGRWSRPP